VVLSVARTIEPDARGYGTHVQLGLPPCGFLTLTGFPCPGCGLTTAFAHGIRGDFGLAAMANPLGLLLFLCVCAVIPISVVAIFRGWSFTSVVDALSLDRWAIAVAGCGVVVWVVRLTSAL
jgi:hypothetical protein